MESNTFASQTGRSCPASPPETPRPPASSSAHAPQKSSRHNTHSDIAQEGMCMARTGSDHHLTRPDRGLNVNNPSTRRRDERMCGLKVGLADQLVNARQSPTALVRASYLTAVASRIDSLWPPRPPNTSAPAG